jgi:hypothetical protein
MRVRRGTTAPTAVILLGTFASTAAAPVQASTVLRPPADPAASAPAGPGSDHAPAPGASRLSLRSADGMGPIDVEVTALIDGAYVFLAQERLDPGGQLDVDVPATIVGNGVHVRGQVPGAAGSAVAVPELFAGTVLVEPGRIHHLHPVPRPRPPRRPEVSCPPAPGGRPGPDHAATDADLDGDGDGERVVLAPTGERAWQISATGLGPGGAIARLELPVGAEPRLIGAADADGDGTDELFAVTGRDASTEQVQLLGLRDCALAPVHLDGTGPATFPIGASARHKAGLTCAYGPAGATLSTWRATSDEQRTTFTFTLTDHTWAGPAHLVTGGSATWRRTASDEWALLQASSLRCGLPPHLLVQQHTGVPPAPVVAEPSLTG